jgi:hypothetical protein
MNVKGLVGAVALSSIGVIGGVAAPAVAGSITTITTTLHCDGKYPVDASYELRPLQVRILKAAVDYINAHPELGTTCTVTP